MAETYLTVSALTQYLKRKFDLDPYLSKVYLTGEISNFRQRPGHQYFSLKDDHAKISVVMFKNAFNALKFKPEEGMKVMAVGRVTLYEASGNYQIVLEEMAPDGVGALYQAFEQLKAKLEKEGLFNQPKRALPMFPRKIAVVTSPSGAVIQDIMTTVARRYPLAQIVLYPAQVQGDTAAATIVSQLNRVREAGDYDALIIGRGGGSIEDLWPFNEEIVARALASMPMPVVSSVGHETDTTIADFVADRRAATPTAAAELVTPITLADALNRINQDQLRIQTAMQNRLKQQEERLKRVSNSMVLTQPSRLYDQYLQRVDQLQLRLQAVITAQLNTTQRQLTQVSNQLNLQSLQQRIQLARQNLTYLTQQLNQQMVGTLNTNRQQFQATVEALDHLSPLKILARGYTYVTDDSGNMLKQTDDFKPDQQATIHVTDGTVAVNILEVHHGKTNI
ncbi:exodeoxyribonuclease VII large subunit [Lacticaseibacillus saniviri]